MTSYVVFWTLVILASFLFIFFMVWWVVDKLSQLIEVLQNLVRVQDASLKNNVIFHRERRLK